MRYLLQGSGHITFCRVMALRQEESSCCCIVTHNYIYVVMNFKVNANFALLINLQKSVNIWISDRRLSCKIANLDHLWCNFYSSFTSPWMGHLDIFQVVVMNIKVYCKNAFAGTFTVKHWNVYSFPGNREELG